MASTPGAPLLQMRGITTRFPGVVANDNVDFDVRAGEVHALLGENGAGKSTLMRVLFGLQRAEAGDVFLAGQPLRVRSPSDAIAAGIGMIHQHFMLVPTLTVAENVALGQATNPFGSLGLGAIADRLGELSAEYELGVHPHAKVWQLSVGERQRVEILKAVFHETRLLVLDEPTAVLTPPEVDQLLATLRRMADAGQGLVFISHKLHEVMAFADRITVMRDGVVTGEVRPDTTTRQELADLMVGRPVKLAPDRTARPPGAAVLEVRGVSVIGDRGQVAVDDVSLEVHAGEVLGIAGVSGNGQRELAETIAGLRGRTAGSVVIGGEHVDAASPRQGRASGLAYVPEERMRDGAIGSFTVWENLLLLDHGQAPVRPSGTVAQGDHSAPCRTTGPGVRRADTGARHAHAHALGRQHPEADHGQGGVLGAARARRLATDPWCRHRCRRVHPRQIDGGPRRWSRRARHLRGPRRGSRPQRPCGGDVRRPSRRHPRPDRLHYQSTRHDDGRRRRPRPPLIGVFGSSECHVRAAGR